MFVDLQVIIISSKCIYVGGGFSHVTLAFLLAFLIAINKLISGYIPNWAVLLLTSIVIIPFSYIEMFSN